MKSSYPKKLLCVLIVVCLVCLLIPLQDHSISLTQAKLPPSLTHWFGTDLLGRDLFWRIVASFKVSIAVGVGASSLALVFALVFVVFFHFCSYLATLGERILEVFLAFPPLLFVMFMQSFFSGGLLVMIFVIALGHWALIAKVLQSEIDKLQKQDFYQCARVLGASKLQALWREILPACVNLLVILWILNFIYAIGNEATLSFFGLGIEPTQPSLGNILADSAKAVFVGGWWMLVFPIVALGFLVVPMLLFAQALQKQSRLSLC